MAFSHNIEDYPGGIILPIDKPYRWTSADVVRKIKYAAIRHFGKKKLKVGHAGTLDPLATGILLVCIGPATKKAEELQRSPKQYLAGVSFGATTPSYDLEKDIDRTFPTDGINADALREILPSFIGEQEQVAPLFSAKSVDGVRAYETARRLFRQAQRTGEAFDHSAADLLQTNLINIYSLELEDFRNCCAAAEGVPSETRSRPGGLKPFCSGRKHKNACCETPSRPRLVRGGTACGGAERSEAVSGGTPSAASGRINVADISGLNLPTAMLRVDCSKGTYIRALARDLGEALGSGAFLSSLRRTKNGGFSIEDAISLEDAMKLFISPAA